MRVFLIGGGSGGHIIPLLAVARELKQLRPSIEIVGVCEKGAKFVHLYQNEKAIDRVFQISAGKYRRYGGLKWHQKATDIKTGLLNTRDVGRTLRGYVEAKRLLQELRPDAILFKGGFVSVPVGKAAAKLGIPYMTHDSDSTPGLANRLISAGASKHATGMPAELYSYAKDKTIYTGVPVSEKYKKLNSMLKATYRDKLGLSSCRFIVTVTGASQGGEQLNKDFLTAVQGLVQQFPDLGIVHVAGPQHEKTMRDAYAQVFTPKQLRGLLVLGFSHEIEVCNGAADVVVTRAGATTLAELTLQSQAVIVVPGKLAGGHQDKNAQYLEKKNAAVVVNYGDAKGLERAIIDLLNNPSKRAKLAENIHRLAKPDAAKDLAQLVLSLAEK